MEAFSFVLSILNEGYENIIMIGFLKVIFCVQVLLKNYHYYYFGQLLDSSQLVIIFPFHVKTYENCEMYKANY